MNKLIILIFVIMFILVILPTNTVSADEPNIFLIKSLKDYKKYGFDIKDIDLPVYTNEALIDFNMPFVVEKQSVALSLTDKDLSGQLSLSNSKSNAEFNKRVLNYKYKIVAENKDYYVVNYYYHLKANNVSFSVDFIPSIKGLSFDKFAWWNSTWLHKEKITFDCTQVPADLTNFPVLLDFTSSNLSTRAQADGDDICFVDSTESVQLNHELESYVGATGVLVAWVNVTSLSSSVDTEIYMYFGNAVAVNQEHVTDTWDANFKAVWHMCESSGSLMDSTVNNEDGTFSGGLPDTARSGHIDGCQDMDGTGDYVDVPDSFDSLDKGTLEMFFNIDAQGINHDAIISSCGTTANFLRLDIPTTNKLKFTIKSDSNLLAFSSDSTFSASTWYYVGVRVDSSSNGMFINGDADVPVTYTTGDSATRAFFSDISAAQQTYLNRFYYSGTYYSRFNGLMDEVRISDISRSDSWVITSYNTMHNNSDGGFFMLYGMQNQSDSECTATSLIPSNFSVDVALDLALLSVDLNCSCGLFNYSINFSNYTVSANSVGNNTYTLDISDFVFELGVNYTWYVNVSGCNISKNFWFNFTTIDSSCDCSYELMLIYNELKELNSKKSEEIDMIQIFLLVILGMLFILGVTKQDAFIGFLCLSATTFLSLGFIVNNMFTGSLDLSLMLLCFVSAGIAVYKVYLEMTDEKQT